MSGRRGDAADRSTARHGPAYPGKHVTRGLRLVLVTRERAALHEAGHALVAHRLGWLVERIVVEEVNGEVEAHTVAGPPPGAGPPTACDNLLYVCGGFVAEAIQLGVASERAVRRAVEQGSRDGALIKRYLSDLAPDSERDERLDKAAQAVEVLLRREWDDVVRIKEHLVRHRVCHLKWNGLGPREPEKSAHH